MDWVAIIKKEYEYVKIQKEKQINRIWHENLLATSAVTQTEEAGSAKWNPESDTCMQNDASHGKGRDIPNVFMLPPQTPLQSMTMWLPISRNFVTRDFEEPHLSDRSGRDTNCESIDDEMFVWLVRRMVRYQSSTSATSSTEATDGHQSADPIVDEEVPDAGIFQSISSFFDGNYTADKYMKLTKCKTTSCTPNIDEPMGAPIQPHQSLRSYRKYFCRRCCLYNCQLHPPADNADQTSFVREKIVDELMPFTEPCSNTCYLTKTLAGDATLLENTKKENPTEFGEIFIPESAEDFDQSFDEISPSNLSPNLSDISFNTFDQIFGEIVTNSSESMAQSSIIQTVATDADAATDPEPEWSSSDLSLFLVLFNVFPYNCCAIAMTMRKSCEEVHRKMVLRDPPVRADAKKKSIRKERSKFHGKLQRHLTQTYSPCNHMEPCDQTTKCMCQNCEKYCSCGLDCKKRMPNCSCKGSCTTLKCLCYFDQRECDAECECHSCKNMEIQTGRGKKLQIISSSIHGWGVMVDETCQKDDFISEYKGEIISIEECERREKFYDKSHCTYMFNLNGDSVIDARFFSNKLRFLNFSETPNCYCRVMMVNGDHRIGVYAARNIAAGEELTIDYVTYDPTRR
ncbi:histone-lysine N-methyltransferase EZH2-like [Bradysia coprophila]|uniref:histone-lysine N-methyltransferase EZH2-like n=1 Tax=Bradysia coprophila TaxID=38358 RepID=UPI00187D90AC|nr:histone-lysine N-methyltransferase EZH2-like [Bradysia coprophila]